MWSLFSIHDSAYVLLSFNQMMSAIHLEAGLQQFFLLGIIPATDIQITFADIIVGVWLIGFFAMSQLLYGWGQNAIKNMDPYSYLPAGMTYFDSIAL